MPVAAPVRPASGPTRLAPLAARIRGWHLHPNYDPSRFALRADDPAIALPGGRGDAARLCDLLCRRTWVIACENAGPGPIRLDRWDLFSAAADVSADLSRVPTGAILRAVADAAEFLGLD